MKPAKTPEEHLFAALGAAIVIAETMPGLFVDRQKSESAWDEFPLSAEAFWSVLVGEVQGHGQSRRVIVARAKLMRRAIRSKWVAKALWDRAVPHVIVKQWKNRNPGPTGCVYEAMALAPALGIRIYVGSPSVLPLGTGHFIRSALMSIAKGARP